MLKQHPVDSATSADPLETDEMIRLRDSAFATDMFIAAVAWLDVFQVLSTEPMAPQELFTRVGVAERPGDVMVTLLKSWELLAEESGRLTLTDRARRHLVAGAACDLSAYYASLKDRPTVHGVLYFLQTGYSKSWEEQQSGGKEKWTELMKRPDFAEFYTAGMDSRGRILAPALAEVLPCQGYSRLLDVAGGSGIYAAHAVKRHPHLRAAVSEKPPVHDVTRHHVEKQGLGDRIDVIGADMFTDPFPAGYDIHLYSHILHDWPLDKCRQLVAKSFETLDPGGMIAIYSAHLNADKTGPAPVAEYSVLMSFLYEGRCYSVEEMRRLLEDAGFRDMAMVETVGFRSLITARKPD